MTVIDDVRGRILAALTALKSENELPADLLLDGVEADIPRDPSHGDFATNAALVLTKRAGKKPREIAELLAAKLRAEPDLTNVEVAGPGFINLTFEHAYWHGVVGRIVRDGASYGRGLVSQGERINIEYVSANPTGPMHVGHCRGAVFGDALANLLAFAGYDVTREYYINDAGGQVDTLARSAFLRYREALGEPIGEIPAGLYPGDYLIPVGEALSAIHGATLRDQPEDVWLPVIKAEAMKAMLAEIRSDLARLGITHDVFFSEASLTSGGHDRIAETIAHLRERGLIYDGHLPPPKGEKNDDWEDRSQTLFKATEFGDDVDRALQKSDGAYTYFAADMAYHKTKLDRGFSQLINVWGADHKGYIKRMQAAVAALSGGSRSLDVKVGEMVRFMDNGEPVKMSKRSGTFVTLRDVVDQVGSDPVRFMMVYRTPETILDFDFAKVTEQSKDNPVFYVQYAHARIVSIQRNAAETFPGLTVDADEVRDAVTAHLSDPGEIALIKKLADFPRIIDGAARAKEPHRLAFYLYEVASALHGQWNRGNDSPHLRFITEDRGVTAARLHLLKAVQRVITSGLGILGVQAPDAMR
ncbi:MAG: arginine--tRNA ligase [Hyphomicrobiaceae bacterium]|nr:arginine--tRNA ligase [Hyphomicrobiaceae bacterium]